MRRREIWRRREIRRRRRRTRRRFSDRKLRRPLLPDDFAGGAGVVSGVVTRVFFSEFFPRPFPFPSTCGEVDDDVVASAVP